MNLSSLEPALIYRSEKSISDGYHWTAWDCDGKQVLNGLGNFDMFSALLTHRGYYILPNNSALAMDIRNQWRDKGIK